MAETYVIKNGDKFIGVDSASGGYPYDTELPQAKIWSSRKEAYEYKLAFGEKTANWTLHSIFLVAARWF